MDLENKQNEGDNNRKGSNELYNRKFARKSRLPINNSILSRQQLSIHRRIHMC